MSDYETKRDQYIHDHALDVTLSLHYVFEAAENRIAEMEAMAAKYKWQRDEAIADGPGYFPKDALERRWVERGMPQKEEADPVATVRAVTGMRRIW